MSAAPILTLSQASQRLTCSKKTLYALVKARKIAFIRLGDSKWSPIRISVEAIDRYLATHTTPCDEPVRRTRSMRYSEPVHDETFR